MIAWWQPITVFACLVFSAFFSAAETALTSISPTKALQIIESGHSGSHLLKHWLHSPAKILTTILIGNNVVNIIATAITTLISERLFRNSGIAVTTGVMTFLIITFGEIIPKTTARYHAVKLSVPFMRLLIIFYYLFYPVTVFFVFLSEKILRTPSLHYSRKGPLVTLKDLDFFISLAQKEGELTGSKGTYLKAVSAFSELRVKNVMIPQNKVATINANIGCKELINLLKKDMYTRYPVVNDNGTFIGILHTKDFLLNIEKCEQDDNILDILRPAYWTNEFMKIDYVLELMKVRHTQMFLVKNEYNQFNGVIAMEDILEELVGEIEDEHDLEEQTNEENGVSNTFVVNGEDSVHDINAKHNISIPEDKDFQTFNGFMLDVFNGVLPKKDTLITWENLSIRILKTKNKSIEEAEITIL